jgi:hypothetical protein
VGKALLTASAAFLFVAGVVLNFAPGEAATAVGRSGADLLPYQLLGGALLGVAVLNWFSRERPFGGIYGRPLGLANVFLFVVGAFALGRTVIAADASAGLWALFAVYAALAVAFVWTVFLGAPKLPQGES